MTDDAPALPPVDFLAIGHICHDLTSSGTVAGGAAAYGASAAHALGCRAGIVTSAASEDEWQLVFPNLAVHQSDAPATTVFENVYTPSGRVQTLHAAAGRLAPAHVPPLWRRSPMVQIGPIANEVDPSVVHLFSDSVIGVCPQGWMRRWDDQGRVYPVAWESAAEIMPLAAVTFVSLEDMADASLLSEYRALASVLVVTEGDRGCTVYCRDEARSFPAPAVPVVDETGAGDIFAAAFLVRFHQTAGNLWDAARFANQVAARSVTCSGLPAKVSNIRRWLDEATHPPAGDLLAIG